MEFLVNEYKVGAVFERECNTIEARLWVVLWRSHSNPAMREFANYLIYFYELDLEFEVDENRPRERLNLTPLQLLEIENWCRYLEKHSLPGFKDLAEFIPEWLVDEENEV